LIYPPELEVKETTDTASSASFLDLYLEFWFSCSQRILNYLPVQSFDLESTKLDINIRCYYFNLIDISAGRIIVTERFIRPIGSVSQLA
jgi:hypothetical protein